MKINTIPYTDANSRIHEDIKIFWDLAITKMSGLDRWRFLIVFDHLEFLDGTRITGGMPKIFCVLRFAGIETMFDARQGLISNTPLKASAVSAEPIRANRDDTGNVAIIFSASSTDKPGKGFSFGKLIPIKAGDLTRVRSTVD